MRRRALLAASYQSGATSGGEFYVKLYFMHPIQGEILRRTATFIIDTIKTWEEAAGLTDTEERSKIAILTLPGMKVVTVSNIKKEDGTASFSPIADIKASDKIIIGHTYEFYQE